MALTVIPQFLQLTNRPCLMLGDNQEAITKGRVLMEAGAELRVMAADPKRWPSDLAQQITWISGPLQPQQLDDVWLVVSTLEEKSINQQLFSLCQARHIFLNTVDQPQFCSFIWPAVVKKPPFIIAISTAGRGPALAGWLRRKLERELPDNLGELANWFAHWRKKTAPSFSTLQQRGKFWRDLFDAGLLDIYLSGRVNRAEKRIKKALKKKKR
ncbi:MAG: hypothetical protein HQL72_06925 [Magnetococcales bacterium]|nr:hypothetical protein [Magnetococcales bacterium]